MKISEKLMFAVAVAGLFLVGVAWAEAPKADAADTGAKEKEVKDKGAAEKGAKPAEDPEKLMKKKFPALVRKAEDIKRSKERASQYTGRQKQTMDAETKRTTDTWYKDYDRAEKKVNMALVKAEAEAKKAEDKLAAITAKRTDQNAGMIDPQIALAKKEAEKQQKETEALQADLDLLKLVSHLVGAKK